MFLLNYNNVKLFLSLLQKVVRGKIRSATADEIRNSRQAGVTLLLAILILSSVLAISFSLATIMFTEIRTSGDLMKTEPALYAATGVGEQALFNLERHACTDNGPGCYISSFSNNVLLNGTPTVVTASTPIFIDKVKAGSTFGTTLNKYDFCNVTAGPAGCQYGKVIVSYVTSNGSYPLYAYLCEFDPNRTDYLTVPCTQVNQSSQDQLYWSSPNNGFLNFDGSVSLTQTTNSSATWLLNPGYQQQLILTNPGFSDIYVKIETFGSNGTTAKGLPYVGKTAVDINTLNAAVGRKLRVIVPNSQSGNNNVAPGTVVMVKNASGGNSTFDFTATGGSSLPASISITTLGGTGSQTFNNVTPGPYSITETAKSGWSQNSATCVDDNSISYPASAFTVTSAIAVTCTSTNTKNNYDHSRLIAVDRSKVQGPVNLADFPVLVNITDAAVKASLVAGVQTASGNDIVFTTDPTGNTINLSYEKEKYDSATGEAIYWVRIPSLNSSSAASDTSFYMFYGRAGDSDHSNPAGTWNSNFQAVYHMKEDPSGSAPQIKDSTANAIHLTMLGGMLSTNSIAHKIGNGLTYDGVNDQLRNNSSLLTITNYPFTLSAWSAANAGNNGSYRGALSIASTTAGTIFGIGWSGTTGIPTFEARNTTSNIKTCTAVGTSTLAYLVAVHNSSSSRTYYVNGAQCATSAIDVPFFKPTIVWNEQNGTGFLTSDENRVSGVALSADWIKTEYNNQNSPSTFYSVGPEQ